MAVFVPIVEGHGEVRAVPLLLWRIARAAYGDGTSLQVNPPIRIKAGSFLNDDKYFHRYVSLASLKARQSHGIVLILLDCEDGCPAELGPRLLAQARDVARDVVTWVCLAVREYETWFLVAARSLRGKDGLPDDLDPPADADRIRDAKGWLSKRMAGRYDPIVHQEHFTAVFDLDLARRGSRSFERLFDFVAQEATPGSSSGA